MIEVVEQLKTKLEKARGHLELLAHPAALFAGMHKTIEIFLGHQKIQDDGHEDRRLALPASWRR